MPGTNDPAPDDQEAALTAEQGTTADPSLEGTQSDPILDALKPSGHGGDAQKPNPQSQQDYQKRYQSMRPEFDKRGAKLNTWESILKNPKFAELAKTDPEMRQALAKAGYALAQEEAEGGAAEAGDEEQYWQSPEGRADLVEARMDLRYEMEDFAQEKLSRRFTPQEASEVKAYIHRAPKLTVAEAWKLTKSADDARLSAEQKRMTEAQGRRPGGQRPRPTPNPLGGGAEKLDLKKHPSQFNDAEKREYLRNLPE